MNKKFLSILVLAALLLLTACKSGTTSSSSAATPGALEMSPEMRLLVGTLKLDGTAQEVNAAQAAQLLPLWQMLKSLASSGTAAQEEVDAVIQQIQDTMTSDQMAAINAMNLTPQEMFTTMQNLGLSMGSGTPAASSGQQGNLPSGSFSSSGPVLSGPGGGPAGAPPSGGGAQVIQGSGGEAGGGGFVINGDPNTSGGSSATPQAGDVGGAGTGVPTQFLDALIEYLQTKAPS